MQTSSGTIFALTMLAIGNFSQQAIAATNPVSPTPVQKPAKFAVPVTDKTPVRVEAIASPEIVIAQKFSQNPVKVQSGASNNSIVVATAANVGNGKFKIPVETRHGASLQRPNSLSTDNNLVVTATNVQVVSATQELQQIIRKVIKTQAGGETSQSQLQADVAAILNTGLFASVHVNSHSTPAGLNVVYQVQPVVVRSLQLSGAKALTYQVALERFQPQIGKAISPTALQQTVQQINQWYTDNGYNIARVISIKPSQEGILTVNVAEGLVGDVKFRFVNDEGKTVVGRTKPDFLRQQLVLKPGEVLKEDVVRQDLQQMYKLGLFENINVALEGDATQVDLVYELKELGARSVNVGGNYSAEQGVLGTLSYQDRNIGGTNNTLGANIEVGSRDLQFDTSFTSPYRESNPDRLGYRVNAFRKRGLSETFDGDVKLANGDRIREGQIGGGVSFQRPIDGWDTSLGFNYSRTSLRDRDGKIVRTDEKGNPLSFSGTGIDDLATVAFSATKDNRNHPINPTQGYVLNLGTEQSVPIGLGNISMNRLRANYSQYVPLKLFNSQDPQVLAVNLQGGTVIGNLPPSETFNLGGQNSVRGYGSGDVGSGRSYVLASAEYRFPIFQPLGGVVFADFASDLGSGDTVLGQPATVRSKPGKGFGYGAGVRFNSPLGLLRADYGITDQGERRLQFGIGHRF